MADPCSIMIPWPSVGPEKTGPVKLNVISDDGEAFTLAMDRSEWTRLIRGLTEVRGWIEPLEG